MSEEIEGMNEFVDHIDAEDYRLQQAEAMLENLLVVFETPNGNIPMPAFVKIEDEQGKRWVENPDRKLYENEA